MPQNTPPAQTCQAPETKARPGGRRCGAKAMALPCPTHRAACRKHNDHPTAIALRKAEASKGGRPRKPTSPPPTPVADLGIDLDAVAQAYANLQALPHAEREAVRAFLSSRSLRYACQAAPSLTEADIVALLEDTPTVRRIVGVLAPLSAPATLDLLTISAGIAVRRAQDVLVRSVDNAEVISAASEVFRAFNAMREHSVQNELAELHEAVALLTAKRRLGA